MLTPRVRIGIPVAVAIITFVCFLPALGAGFLNWDDGRNFTENPHYRGFTAENIQWMFTTCHMGHYIPITWMTLALDYELWGMNPFGYHFSSMVFHALATVLVYLVTLALLRKIRDDSGPGLHVASAIAALFFGMHPLRVESVAWITERRDVLSGIFFCATLLTYLKLCTSDRRLTWYGATWLLFVCALLCKSMVLTLPIIMLLLDIYPLRRFSRRSVLEKIPFIAVAFADLIVTWQAQRAISAIAVDYPITDSLLQPGYRAFFYLAKSALPSGLSPLYPMEHATLNAVYGLAAAGLAGLSLLSIRRRPMAVTWFSYLALLIPVIGIVHGGPQQVADRYSYLPAIAWTVPIGAAFYPHWNKFIAIMPAVAILGLLGFLTSRQTEIWKDSVTLWTRALDHAPSVTAYVNRGLAFIERREFARAVEDLDRALQIDPRDVYALCTRSDARLRQGDVRGALTDAEEAVKIDPGHAPAYFRRALARPDPRDALSDLTEAVRLDPGQYVYFNQRGLIRGRMEDWNGAIADYTEALRLFPMLMEAYSNRALARHQKGDFDGAIADYTEALRLEPRLTGIYFNRAEARRAKGDIGGAIADYSEAIRFNPQDVEARVQRARCFRQRGDFGPARTDLMQALQMSPGRKDVEAELNSLPR
jgi:tetratricopeptide (TPR) repeat protein